MASRPKRRPLVAILLFVGFAIVFVHVVRPSSIFSWPSARIGNSERYAIATFLSTRVTDDAEDDPYFTATRVLAYQLLHQPETRIERSQIPFLVLVPPHVSERKRQVLRAEGAVVLPVEVLSPQDRVAHPLSDRWIDQYTKLRLWELTEYTRILYMDSDMLIMHKLDGIWNEDSVHTSRTVRSNDSGLALPSDFVMTGAIDNERPNRERPTQKTFASRMSGGFFILKPSKELFKHYVSILETQRLFFDEAFMEMGLLNYAHRYDGPMPWTALLPDRWNNNWPQLVDLQSGSATLHDKFWDPGNEDWIDRKLVEMWWRTQGRMEGYWQSKGN